MRLSEMPFEWLTLEERRRLFDYHRDVRKTAAHFLRYQSGVPMGEPYYLLTTARERQTGVNEVTLDVLRLRCTPLACPLP